MPKGKKIKVLTHRSRYIEPAEVPEFGARTSSAMETKETAPPTQNTEESSVMPKMPTVTVVETKVDKAETLGIEEITKGRKCCTAEYHPHYSPLGTAVAGKAQWRKTPPNRE